MKRIRIIAIISAIVTALAVYIYLANVKKPVDIQRAPVVVATQKIAAGQEVTAGMVEVKNLPVEAINAQAARSADDVVGHVSSAETEPGEQLLLPRLVKTGSTSNTLAYALDKGMRAFTLSVDPVSGVDGLIKPQDHVDVLIIIGVQQPSLTPQDMPLTTTYSETLLQNILVLATGQVMQPDSDDKTTTVDTVTVSVTPDQAVQLNLAASEGKVRLVLRSPVDTATPTTQPLQVQQLLH